MDIYEPRFEYVVRIFYPCPPRRWPLKARATTSGGCVAGMIGYSGVGTQGVRAAKPETWRTHEGLWARP